MKSKTVFNNKRLFCKRKYLLLATYTSTELTDKADEIHDSIL